VLVIGDDRWNAARTLLSGSLQPSELAKPVLIIYLASGFRLNRTSCIRSTSAWCRWGHYWLYCLLDYPPTRFQRGFTLFIMGILLFFLAGGKLNQTLFVILIVITMAWLAVSLHISGTLPRAYNPGLQA